MPQYDTHSIVAPTHADVTPTMGNPRRSQDSWRPNASLPSSQAPPGQRNEGIVSQPRNSWEPQRSRGPSGPSHNPIRQDAIQNDRGPWPAPSSQYKAFEQPPSSAQRYPGLFRSEPGPDMHRDSDMPAHYYQSPIPREAAFLPRQQTNEYQLPGVGPPMEQPLSAGSKRNSGFFRELGGRISRGTSKERSRSRGLSSSGRPFDSRGNEYAASSITSEEGQERKKRRGSFFGNLSRSSTGGLVPPQSRESVVAHHSGSRTDLLDSQPVHVEQRDKKRSFFSNHSVESKNKSKLSRASTSGMVDEPGSGRKKRFSGLSSFFNKSSNGPVRASTTVEHAHPQAVNQFSYNERQPTQSPFFDQRTAGTQASPNNYNQSPNQNPIVNTSPTDRAVQPTPSRPSLLSKFSNTSTPPQSARKESRTRRPSAAGLLNGIIGRRSHQQERERDSSRSQESQSQTAAQPLPPAQTYTDLQEQQALEPPVQQQQPLQTRSPQAQERGRRVSREPEPQYDSVPIPGGYSLVRGQGAMVVPTEYDPRGLSRQQTDPRSMQTQPQAWSPNQQNPPQMQARSAQSGGQSQYSPVPVQGNFTQAHSLHNAGQIQHSPASMQGQFNHSTTPNQYGPSSPSDGYPRNHNGRGQQSPHLGQMAQSPVNGQGSRDRPPNLSALETFETYQARSATRRLSRESILARSPARTPLGQQPPYQLTLPDDDDDEEDRPLPIEKDPIIETDKPSRPQNRISTNVRPQNDSIQRLQQPILRHPGSPASYTLPDTAFSPINLSAEEFPPPPPPEWPPNLDPERQTAQSQAPSQNDGLNLSMDLDRSNTRRTAMSGISQVSKMSGQQEERRESLGVPTAEEKEMGIRRVSSPSLTPSPLVTPERVESPTLAPPTDRGRTIERGSSREKSPNSDVVKTTLVARGPSPDIYDASPRIPKSMAGNLITSKIERPPTERPAVSNNSSSSYNNISSRNVAASRNGEPATKKSTVVVPVVEQKNLAPIGQRTPIASQEEKIWVEGGEQQDEEALTAMSATSYPGQEWNPYLGGAYEDGFD